jgi:TetR/AcrR family transcriptional regulator, acrAB operon repressor
MGRKTKAQAADTRERLLDAAERVFLAQGVAKTSLTTVAAAAGVTRGAVYWHFKDKADLFAAMCQRATLPFDAMLAQAGAQPQADPLGAVHTLAVATLTRLANDSRMQAVFEVVFHRAELTGELAAIAGHQERDRRAGQANVQALFEQSVRSGQLPADTDTALAARLVHAAVSGIMGAWVQDKGAYNLAARAPCLVETMLAGVVANPPRQSARIRPRVRPRADMI